MDRNQTLIYNVTGQSVVLDYPPEWVVGVPTSATYSVWRAARGDDDTVEFSGSGTIDAVSTTVDAASGVSESNPRKLSLASTTSIVIGRYYLVENASSQRELVKIVKITSADSVEVEFPLSYDYASGATFKGLQISFVIDATF